MGKRKRSYSRSYSHKDRDSSRSKRKKRSPSRNKKYSRRSKSRSKSYSNRKRNHHSSTSSKSSNKSIPKITRIITEEEKKRELEVKRQMRLAKARLLKFEKEDDPKPNNDRRRKDYQISRRSKDRKEKDDKKILEEEQKREREMKEQERRKKVKQLLGDSDGLEDEENHSQDRTEDRNKQRKELEEKKEKILSNQKIRNDHHRRDDRDHRYNKYHEHDHHRRDDKTKRKDKDREREMKDSRDKQNERQRERESDKQKLQKSESNILHANNTKQDQKNTDIIAMPTQKNYLAMEMEFEEDPMEAYMRQLEHFAVPQKELVNVKTDRKWKGQSDDNLTNFVVGPEDIFKQDQINLSRQQTNLHEAQNEDDDDYYREFLKKMQALQDKEKSKYDMYQYEDSGDDDNSKDEQEDIQKNKAKFLYDEELQKLSKKNQEKKDIKPVDHAQQEYKTFRKNFYIETKEISDMNAEQITQIRKELGDIKVRGKDILKPIVNWYQIDLGDRVLNVLIDKKAFLKPFPIQAQAIPCIMSGRDVIGIAETGSGKTLAYLLPMLRHIMDQPALKEGDGPIGIIMAPTRELAHQIFVEAKSYTKVLNIEVVCCVGGAGIAGQLSELRKGAEIIVCTPGRMIDVLTTNNGRILSLKRVTFVVIDEADRMFDLGFEPQINKILQVVRPDRQTVMFSATFPRNVEMLAKKLLQRPIEIIVGSRGHANMNVEQLVEYMEDSDRLLKLWEILEIHFQKNPTGQVIVFVEKQSEADELFKELIRHGDQCYLLHGGMDPTDREYAISDFRRGLKKIMIATSICARGLDIKAVSLVVNFKCPNHMEDYIHRIGRTGRAGNKGTAITFFTNEDEQYAQDLMKALEASQQFVPEFLKRASKRFKGKVEMGEAKVYYNKNLSGTGFKFNEQEKEKINQIRQAIQKQLGMENRQLKVESSDEEEFLQKLYKKKSKQADDDPTSKLSKTDREKIMELIKDPSLKSMMLQEATAAANDAIQHGLSRDQVQQSAINAIRKVLSTHKSHKTEGGIQEAMRLIDEFEEKEKENSDHITFDFEINDYPLIARQKVCNREFIQTILDLTNCQIHIRGTFVEAGKKPPLGQKRLFLRIIGESEYYVLSAYKEIKRLLEDYSIPSQPQSRFTI